MEATSQLAIAAAPKKDLLSFLMKPWVDKAVAAIAVVPFAWLMYLRFRAFGIDLPRLVFAIHMLVFITTMVTRKTPVCLFTAYSSGKSQSALRKRNFNILYEIGHRITKLDSQLGAAGRAEN